MKPILIFDNGIIKIVLLKYDYNKYYTTYFKNEFALCIIPEKTSYSYALKRFNKMVKFSKQVKFN